MDWVIIEDDIIIITINQSLEPRLYRLNMALYELQAWKGRHLQSSRPLKQDIDGFTKLYNLNALVKLLAEISRPNDLLVFCLLGALNGILLYVLQINSAGELISLLSRNTIIYTLSLSLLRLSYEKVLGRTSKASIFRAAIIADLRGEGTAEEPLVREALFEAAEDISSDFGAERPALGQKATRQSFQELARSTHLLHFHGHMQYGHPNVLLQGLQLNDGDPSQDQLSESELRSGDHVDVLAVRDMFDLEISALLVNIIVCKSGSMDLNTSDEPLGLFTSVLHAGAATVLGILWPVSSDDGINLASVFFKNLKRQLRTEHYTTLNLATAY